MNHSPNDNYQLNQNLWSYPVVGAIQPLNNCDQYYNQMEQHFVVEWVFGSLLGCCLLPFIIIIIFFLLSRANLNCIWRLLTLLVTTLEWHTGKLELVSVPANLRTRWLKSSTDDCRSGSRHKGEGVVVNGCCLRRTMFFNDRSGSIEGPFRFNETI